VYLMVVSDAETLTPRCVELRLTQRPGGPPITTSLVHNRLSVTKLVEEAVQRASITGTIDPDGTVTLRPLDPVTDDDVRRATTPPRRRRNAVTKTDVTEAVKRYRRHKKAGTVDPLQATADELGIARATVWTRIRTAREKGWADV
jgi:hypothetical protein